MTPNEFKAWFEGFSEAVDGAPTPAQWQRISEKVALLTVGWVSPPVAVPHIIRTGIPSLPSSTPGIDLTPYNTCEVRQ